jgi:hypothetical protein
VRILIPLLIGTGGCAFSASALANHNSRGTACLDSSAFGVVDIAIAIGLAAVVGTNDTHPGYYTVPGVFGLSGVIGVIAAERCKGKERRNKGTGEPAPPANNRAPSFGDAPVDPEAREATREELGLDSTPTRLLDRNGIPVYVQPDPTPPPTPTPLTIPTPGPKPPRSDGPTCTLQPRKDCSEGYYCQLVAENTGTCTKIK